MTKHISLILFIAFLVSACGTPAAPTISAEDVQSTVVAAAFTIVAETQAAIPTNTPIPPTDTPTATLQPTDTPILPDTETPAPLPTVTPQVSSGGDPCNQLLKASPAGHPTKIKLVNKTKAPITASLYLNITPFGECGYRGYNLKANDAVTITDLTTGCYSVYVWVNDPNKPTTASGYGCINNPDLWTFEVNAEFVKFVGP